MLVFLTHLQRHVSHRIDSHTQQSPCRATSKHLLWTKLIYTICSACEMQSPDNFCGNAQTQFWKRRNGYVTLIKNGQNQFFAISSTQRFQFYDCSVASEESSFYVIAVVWVWRHRSTLIRQMQLPEGAVVSGVKRLWHPCFPCTETDVRGSETGVSFHLSFPSFPVSAAFILNSCIGVVPNTCVDGNKLLSKVDWCDTEYPGSDLS